MLCAQVHLKIRPMRKTLSNFALHNRWSKIKHVKAVEDPRKAHVGMKISREISVAARLEGPDPASNVRLRLLIDKAKKMNITKKVIEAAIASGTGENSNPLTSTFFNGFAPWGVAILCVVITDKMNRTVQELRKMIHDAGGSLGDASWAFQARGALYFDRSTMDDKIMEIAVGMDAIDVEIEDSEMIVYCDPQKLKLFESALKPREMEFVYYPTITIPLVGEQYDDVAKLISDLENHQDISSVFSNLEHSDD